MATPTVHVADVLGLGSTDDVHVRLRVGERQYPQLATLDALADRVQMGLGGKVARPLGQQRRQVLHTKMND